MPAISQEVKRQLQRDMQGSQRRSWAAGVGKPSPLSYLGVVREWRGGEVLRDRKVQLEKQQGVTVAAFGKQDCGEQLIK